MALVPSEYSAMISNHAYCTQILSHMALTMSVKAAVSKRTYTTASVEVLTVLLAILTQRSRGT